MVLISFFHSLVLVILVGQSCWAHAALSSMADRIKIARNGEGDDINLSIQFVLNCGGKKAGSCWGGMHTGVYQFIKEIGYIPFDTCQPYIAVSLLQELAIPHFSNFLTPNSFPIFASAHQIPRRVSALMSTLRAARLTRAGRSFSHYSTLNFGLKSCASPPSYFQDLLHLHGEGRVMRRSRFLSQRHGSRVRDNRKRTDRGQRGASHEDSQGDLHPR